ncbi:S8 family serine peptidase (plasmid) [Bacillus sp. N447-1]|uniref:S8 family serine peptidase n=1 Tax=Bacillus sp. N447-1 TaxID=2789208 RepID=UPI002490F2F5|nr:S8 family serine peptidase [Bacillus sp. N447-1]UNT71679.1 S8 family serine peptidase [Bacillus sp. N447-1]
MKKKFVKNTAIFALSTAVLLGNLPNINNITTASATSSTGVEQILSKLTPEQRKAIHELKTSDQGGLQLSPKVDLKSEDSVSVIVEFKDKPQHTAMIEAKIVGKPLTETEAKQKVDDAHEMFQNDLKTIFKDELKEKKEPYTIKQTYKQAFNGVAMKLPANKVKTLLNSKAVKNVWSDMEVHVEPPVKEQDVKQQAETHKMVTFPGIEKLHQEGLTGKGVKIGFLDTGIDYNHPDLKDAYKGGYDFVDNDEDPMEATYDDWQKSGKPEDLIDGSKYYTMHGTHVAGIIAGQGKNSTDYAVKGVAPDADLYAYRVLGPYGAGSTSSILAGVDKAVSDGMDIISMSLGVDYNNPLYPVSIAVNNATIAGVTAIVAAGNAGGQMYTLGSPGASPLAITVGASDTSVEVPTYKGTLHADTDISTDLRLMARGYSDKLEEFKGKNLPIVDVGQGDASSYKDKDVKGKLVLVARGNDSVQNNIAVAKQNGAKAVLLYNTNPPLQDIYLGENLNYIPTFSLSNEQGTTIKQKLDSGNTTFSFDDMSKIVIEGDKLAEFSSRGPSRILYDIKPEVTAPGVSVFSTVPSYMNGRDQIGNYQYAYERLSGTSMATPNVSGVAALLKQAHPNMKPADIKANLMNTADPLNGDYSVFEVGAGRVDPYEAAHAQTQIQIKDKTETVGEIARNTGSSNTSDSKESKTIEEYTGALSFGTFATNGKNVQDKRAVVISNNSKQAKTFDVKVQFQTDRRGSKDAAANGVQILTDKTIKVKANSKQNTNVLIGVPKEAALGTYEGYITYTNKDNPEEIYQIPFAIHTVEEGIDHIAVDPPAFTTAVDSGHPGIRWSVGLNFKLKSHMRTMDLFLIDPKTKKEIGFLGTLDGLGADANVDYILRGAMNEGDYYPLTGNPDHPISYDKVQAEPGLYKIRMIGKNDKGKTFSADAPVYYSATQPTLNLSVKSGVYEYSPDQQSVSITGSVHDPGVEEMKSGGIDASQADNKVKYTVPKSNGEPEEFSVPVDANGNFSTKIPMNPNVQPFKVDFYAENKATVQNYSSYKPLYYVKQGTPYGTAIADKQIVKAGETVTFTLSMNNMTNMKQAVYSFIDSNSSSVDLVSVKPHATLEGKVDIKTVNTDLEGETMIKRDITATLTGDAAQTGVSGKVPMVDITYKAKETSRVTILDLANFNVSYTNTDGTAKSTFGISLPYQIERTYSFMKSWISAEAFMEPVSEIPLPLEYVKAGAKAKVTDETGKEYQNTLGSTSDNGNPWHFTSTTLPVTDKPFTLEVDMPGHFTVKKPFTVGVKENGEVKPYSKALYYNQAPAGDVNKDNVIDVKDALAIQAAWKTNKREADINYDGTVDEKDMQYVVNNYLMQNPWMLDKAPKPEEKQNGKSLNDILQEVGMK